MPSKAWAVAGFMLAAFIVTVLCVRDSSKARVESSPDEEQLAA
jgi:hypothetical protein